jgi:hypothetical protein
MSRLRDGKTFTTNFPTSAQFSVVFDEECR